MVVNALSGLSDTLGPKWDLVGPTVDDDIRRLVARYGAAAVKVATKRVTKAKRGPKTLPDWRELQIFIKADAKVWLEGGDPMSFRSNYSIAKEFSEQNPGQSTVSTHQRIERKLRHKTRGRRYYFLAAAESLSRGDFGWPNHIRALEELAGLKVHDIWDELLRSARNNVADYTAKWGQPSTDMNMTQIEEGARLIVPRPSGLSDLIELKSFPSSGLGQLLSDALADSLRSAGT